MRANHYHTTDWHFCYVLERGSLRFFPDRCTYESQVPRRRQSPATQQTVPSRRGRLFAARGADDHPEHSRPSAPQRPQPNRAPCVSRPCAPTARGAGGSADGRPGRAARRGRKRTARSARARDYGRAPSCPPETSTLPRERPRDIAKGAKREDSPPGRA